MKNVAYEASDRCRVNNRFANAPVGIRTRAPGSTGRDHRPLDHRGSGRRKVRSLIILSYRDDRTPCLVFEKPSSRGPSGRMKRSKRLGRTRPSMSPFPFYLRSVMWPALTGIEIGPTV